MDRLRIDETWTKTLPEATAKLVKAMIIGKLVMKGSKLVIFKLARTRNNIVQTPWIRYANVKI